MWRSITSVIWRPTVITGLRLVDGSWKMMLMRWPRTSRMRISGSWRMSSPSTSTVPAVTRPASGSSRRIDSAVIDLPHPDSPTSANVSPRSIVSDSASTARTRPLSESISVVRFSIASIDVLVGRPATGAVTARSGVRGAGFARRTRNARARGSNASLTALAKNCMDRTSATMKPNAAASVHHTTGRATSRCARC